MKPHSWVTRRTAPLLIDFYELTMARAYWSEGLDEEAVFSLFVRRLPARRNYLLACGLDDALTFLETFRFDPRALEQLAGFPELPADFRDWLGRLRFRGSVYAVPEGTPVFANEPILEVVAPIIQAQLAETFVMNQVHFQTLIASKACRMVEIAAGRPVVDFGLRRAHGADAGMKAVRAAAIAGVQATSNVLGGRTFGVPVTGTMAHSYVQAHETEEDAFRKFAALFPETTLLVDTYDTLAGVEKVIALSRELGLDFRVRAVRIDSGDLAALAIRARAMLDEAGLGNIGIFASGGLDEEKIAELLRRNAPVTGFGVGTSLVVSEDDPALDIVYKLTEYGGRGRLKLSPEKGLVPGRKQVFRREQDGIGVGDVIGRPDEPAVGRPLLEKVMENGRRLAAGRVDLASARERTAREISRLPARIRRLEPADPPYPVRWSDALERDRQEITARLTAEPKRIRGTGGA